MSGPYYIGVDVGTSSVRAALVTSTGNLVSSATQTITIWEPQPGYYEQSSDDIWQSCCKVIQMITEGISVKDVHGIGFDATCSLVVLGQHFVPVTVSPSGDKRCNVIMWMDHRATKQAAEIDSTKHSLLQYVGGSVSIEMQLPKLLWLKQNLFNETWKHADHFFDLGDYLTWRASGDLSRSLCSVVCKWMYDAKHGWSETLLQQIGLADLTLNEFSKIGCISCVSDGCNAFSSADVSLTHKLMLVCGTSSCHLVVSEDAIFVCGVWGPYYSAMLPRLWLNEGGQSVTGKLLDHIVSTHAAYSWVKDEAEQQQIHVYSVLSNALEFIAHREHLDSTSLLTRNFHIYPDYHGNRSPLADPSMNGMICGLSLSTGVEDLAIQYIATIQALAYGTRHIVETMCSAGHQIDCVCVCGGLSKNQLYVQCHADVLGLPVIVPQNAESVLLGSAILAACASHDFANLQAAMDAMSGFGKVVQPDVTLKEFHQCKYNVFLEMLQHQKQYQQMMQPCK